MFSVQKYVLLDETEQILYFCLHAGLSEDELARILELTQHEYENYLAAHRGDPEAPFHRPQLEGLFDQFITVMNYVLNLTDYDGEEIRAYMNDPLTASKGRSVPPPPWGVHGLKRYLLEGGRAGVFQAVDWLKETERGESATGRLSGVR